MSLTDGRAPDDELLRRYLIGSLASEETEQIDELSVTDDDVAARLRAVEHDLVDAYVHGELSGELLDRFRSHYLASPANRSRVTFAETLRRYQQKGRLTPAAASASWVRWGLAAAAVMAIAAASYLLAENIRLREQVRTAAQSAALIQERMRELQTQLTQEQSASAETAKELARVRELAAQSTPRSDSTRTSALGLLAFTLRPATRGPETVPTVSIPRGTETILLRLPLEIDDYPRYEAVLKSAGAATETWRAGDLRSTSARGTRILSVAIPARLLEGRMYSIEVSGVPASGSAQYLSSYPFRAVLQ